MAGVEIEYINLVGALLPSFLPFFRLFRGVAFFLLYIGQERALHVIPNSGIANLHGLKKRMLGIFVCREGKRNEIQRLKRI